VFTYFGILILEEEEERNLLVMYELKKVAKDNIAQMFPIPD